MSGNRHHNNLGCVGNHDMHIVTEAGKPGGIIREGDERIILSESMHSMIYLCSSVCVEL